MIEKKLQLLNYRRERDGAWVSVWVTEFEIVDEIRLAGSVIAEALQTL